MLHEPFILSEDFQEALDLLENSRQHVFITGKAGTGKSTLLQLFRKTTQKKTVVLAPTGVAALNVGGQTIHSFFGFAPRLMTKHDIVKRKDRKIMQALEVIVIDEISMVRADLLDHIDYALRLNRNKDEAFGGVQMVFVGDLFQLPPVVSTTYEKQYFQTTYDSPYFFSSSVFSKGFRLEPIELNKVYRQEERQFIHMLDAIRSGDIAEDLLLDLNQRVDNNAPEEIDYIILTARNQVAHAINQKALHYLTGEQFVFQAKVSGLFNPTLYPTDLVLRLKKGAQVMLIKNDPGKKYVNGSIGTIDELDDDSIRILVKDGKKSEVVEVAQHEWEMLKYSTDGKGKEIKSEVIGSFIQYPVRLAWAITVHKSQGQTFDRVMIDLKGGAFEHGQTYVALSRCRTLEGIKLKHPIRYRDILIDERVIDYYRQLYR